jgi:hypothetical protein
LLLINNEPDSGDYKRLLFSPQAIAQKQFFETKTAELD